MVPSRLLVLFLLWIFAVTCGDEAITMATAEIANAVVEDEADEMADVNKFENVDFGDLEMGDASDDSAESGVDSDEVLERIESDVMSADEQAELKASAKSFEFQAEVHRLMDIVVNSLYTNREVFMRELISNAADALEKLRFLAIENPSLVADEAELKITIEYDKANKLITLVDTGVGMTETELIQNLGTVAKSGTNNFLKALKEGGDVSLIGQFGVGFYSAFLVADRVAVVSKSASDGQQHVWESDAHGSFTVAPDPRGVTLDRGTRINLHLKEDASEFLEEKTLSELAKKYSQFIDFPLYIRTETTVKVPKEQAEDAKSDESDEGVKVDDEDEEPKEKAKEMEDKTVYKLHRLNEQKPIWLRSKEELTDADYSAFYKTLLKNAAGEPLARIHFSAEGEVEFKALVFIPPRTVGDPYDEYFHKKHGVKLYVRRVLIGEGFSDLIPDYLSFLKGVVDSDDLPLKVDREHLTQSKVVKVIAKRLTRKVLDVLRKMSVDSEEAVEELKNIEDKVRADERVSTPVEGGEETLDFTEEEKERLAVLKEEQKLYPSFWESFGRNIKLGCITDEGSNRQKIAKLLRYYTTKSLDLPVSLQKIVDRMPKDQTELYYLTGEDSDRMMASPLLQGFIDRDLEVLLLSDAVDDACVNQLKDFDGKKLVSIEKGDVKFNMEESAQTYFEKLKLVYTPLTDWWRKILTPGHTYSRVQLSHRLTRDPVAAVASTYGATAYAEKLFQYQTFVDQPQVNFRRMHKTLEINAQHPIIRRLKDLHEQDPDSLELKAMAEDLAETALLASGFAVERPESIASKVYRAIAAQTGADLSTTVEPLDLSAVELDEKEKVNLSDSGPDLGQDDDFLSQPESHDEL